MYRVKYCGTADLANSLIYSFKYFWWVFALNNTALPFITPTLIVKIILYTYLTDLATVLHKTFVLSYKGPLLNYKFI